MNGPLIQQRIGELGVMFEAEQGDLDALRLPETEHSFRAAPRAITLLVKLRRVLGGGTVSSSARQGTLFDDKVPVAMQGPPLKYPPKAPPPNNRRS